MTNTCRRARDSGSIPDGRQLCEPNLMPTYVLNSLNPLEVDFDVLCYYSKNIKKNGTLGFSEY